MSQASHLDEVVQQTILSGNYKLDIENGILFRIRDNASLMQLGGFSKKYNTITIAFTKPKSMVYPLPRLVWVAAHGFIKDNLIVSHKDGNVLNNKINNLELKPYIKTIPDKAFTEDEIKILKDNYLTMSFEQLPTVLPGRSVKSIRQKAKKLKLKGKISTIRPWSEEEEQKVRELYTNHSFTQIAKIMNRSTAAIALKCTRFFNLKKKFKDPIPVSKDTNYIFYKCLKHFIATKTAKAKCCLCGYQKYTELHHLDGNNQNHCITNIVSLCPNCHREVENNEHEDKKLYCHWWRIRQDNVIMHEDNNYELIHGTPLIKENE